MLKFVVISNSQAPTTHCFDRPSIVIGAKDSTVADIPLDEEGLLDRHVQIITQIIENKPSYFAINLAQDPFVTLNGLPFGKRPLRNNDVIQIGNSSLRFEEEIAPQPATSPLPQEPSTENEFSALDIQALVEQVEAIAATQQKETALIEEANKAPAPPQAPPLPAAPPPQIVQEQKTSPVPAAPPLAHAPKLSLKDYYLSEYDEDNESNQTVREPTRPNPADMPETNYWARRVQNLWYGARRFDNHRQLGFSLDQRAKRGS